MQLGIGIPLTAEKEYTAFWDSFSVMKKPDYVYLKPPFPKHIDDVRNAVVMQAKKAQCTHLLMMDTDQVYYNVETIFKLLESKDNDVTGTVVYRRYPPFDPVVFRFGDQGLVKVPDEEIFSGKIIKVDAIGCGCILYSMRVFDKIDYPWFKDIARENPDAENAPGEDINFCYKLNKAGFQIYCDTSINIGHIFLGIANKSWYLMYKKLMEAKRKEAA